MFKITKHLKNIKNGGEFMGRMAIILFLLSFLTGIGSCHFIADESLPKETQEYAMLYFLLGVSMFFSAIAIAKEHIQKNEKTSVINGSLFLFERKKLYI
ncbi:hypothetical protein MK079_04315 [Candidatus Gracilibacteria bacterium]|nr:hypothetical protein [Candidatus Gracilibacteria bacterium]